MTSIASYATSTNVYEQPSYPEHYWPVVGQQPQYYHSHLSSQSGPFTGMMASEVSPAIPIPSSGEYTFFFETLRNRVLTNRDQPRSTTGGITRAGHPTTRSTWWVLKFDHPYPTPLTPSHRGTHKVPISSTLVGPGLS